MTRNFIRVTGRIAKTSKEGKEVGSGGQVSDIAEGGREVSHSSRRD